jgi:hypothetical protein
VTKHSGRVCDENAASKVHEKKKVEKRKDKKKKTNTSQQALRLGSTRKSMRNICNGNGAASPTPEKRQSTR